MIYGQYQPNEMQTDDNMTDYWERVLFQRACYSIKLDTGNIFDGRAKNFLYYCLFKYGFVSVFEDDKLGLLFQPAGIKGYNVYYQPTNLIVSNPAFKTKDLVIGDTCEILQLTPDYRGIWDTIHYYAAKLATLDPAVDISIKNSKMPYILFGKTKSARASLRKMMDKINAGFSSIFLDERLVPDGKGNDPISILDRPHLKESYITDKLLADRMTIMQEFDREIGIATVPYQKKERMVEYEAESSVEESQARITIWIECLNESFKRINEKYHVDFKAERRVCNGYSENNADRDGKIS